MQNTKRFHKLKENCRRLPKELVLEKFNRDVTLNFSVIIQLRIITC